MIYREASIQDLDSILNLYKQLNPDEKIIDIDEAKNIWKNVENNKWIKYFIAEDKNKIVSSCYIAIIPNMTRNGKSIGFIENVITDKEYRRKGIGKEVINKAIGYAKILNCYKVVLLSNQKRKEAHSFYESIGFDGNSKRGFQIKL
jgi:GNAT superfamily N-acetyltransferase